ncbi:MAG: long-chain fatty acid--CoA ligase [Candidatus Cloacimonadota bacterium]|nr:MAG: long-chain fatty acid--CoA ligase [Candidatus Cloacimonadota bacterium]
MSKLTDLLEDSIKRFENEKSFADYPGKGISYFDVAFEIRKLHNMFKALDINKQDKIALVGKNCSNWAVVYLAAITYGAVIVPVLPDFNPDDIKHIAHHSESAVLFAETGLLDDIDPELNHILKAVISLENFRTELIKEKYKKAVEEINKNTEKSEFLINDLNYGHSEENDPAALAYTSGTTGFSKGVILTHGNLNGNVVFAAKNLKLERGERILSFLPLAHAFGCAFEFLFPFTCGCFISFLNKTPSPKTILKAFDDVKPALILSVPLIMEKIYRKKIKPRLDDPKIKFLLKIPGISNLIYKSIKKSLRKSFGGNYKEIVIGGAPLHTDVEEFFNKTGLRFTVGYGMTECGPLISYAPWNNRSTGGCGKIVSGMKVKIVKAAKGDPVGEIVVKGTHCMSGYYKNKEATDAVIDKNGWLHTGDIGFIDENQNIHIRGRSKNMILGSGGQNIYPEEIEAKVNGFDIVSESVIYEKDGLILLQVYPDFTMLDKKNVEEKEIKKMFEKLRREINMKLPDYSKISRVKVRNIEFEKSPTKKIKRHLIE